jgi:hypothetical protein
MGILKWVGIVVGGLFLLLLLLPGTPQTGSGGGARRGLTDGQMASIGMMMGGMVTCGADSGWIANTRIRLRDQAGDQFRAHFEPAYAAGQRLARDASPSTCADMLASGRRSIDGISTR